MAKISVQETEITVLSIDDVDYISLTDMANGRIDQSRAADVIKNWLRTRYAIEFLGTWEILHNPNFKVVEFDHFKSQAGLVGFVLSASEWIENTNAIGLIVRKGKYGGTYAHKDIAFEFGSAISVQFKLYLIEEYQRLKEFEQRQLGWSVKRELTKINYRIHTDAVKQNLIPIELSPQQMSIIYANEADVLNMALFGMTAAEWRIQNPEKQGNIRDYANVSELICLANLENLNALFINEGMPQDIRLKRLNQIAISQMRLLLDMPNALLVSNANTLPEKIE
ncbi:MAG: KilA-N domain-containing protein [Victivallales bacterium]|nr:KilA-N domain-containing protein [Victivallales bacterium]